MSEKALAHAVMQGMNPYWDATRHEDKLNLGIPDISFGIHGYNGWMELKYADLPKRHTSIIRLPHYTPEQKAFLDRRGHAGGRCYLALQIDRSILFFNHTQAQYVGILTYAELCANCFMHWPRYRDREWLDLADFIAEDHPVRAGRQPRGG